MIEMEVRAAWISLINRFTADPGLMSWANKEMRKKYPHQNITNLNRDTSISQEEKLVFYNRLLAGAEEFDKQEVDAEPVFEGQADPPPDIPQHILEAMDTAIAQSEEKIRRIMQAAIPDFTTLDARLRRLERNTFEPTIRTTQRCPEPGCPAHNKVLGGCQDSGATVLGQEGDQGR